LQEDAKNADGKLLCWLCSLSYKRALVRTKQSDPARHSRVFRDERKEKEKEKQKEKRYFPKRITWDRCYDFLNIFAEKFSEDIGVFDAKQS
jgi:hypothetical protein